MKNRTLYHLMYKEFSESRKNHKLLIVVITFLFFGLLSPLTAKYMPELLKMAGTQQGMYIEAKPPVVQDSLVQFHSNVIQVCLFIMIFIIMGMISREKERGTAAFLLVKPVSREIFILSKYLSMLALVAIGMTVGIGICGVYTYILFGSVSPVALLKMSFFLFIYLLEILSITILLSTLSSRQVFAGIGTFIIWLLLEALSSLPVIGKLLPGGVSREAQAAGAGMSIDLFPLIGAAGLITFCIVTSLYCFKKWEA